jgi:hypothetical protein
MDPTDPDSDPQHCSQIPVLKLSRSTLKCLGTKNIKDPSYLLALCAGARAVDGGGGSPGEPGHLPPLQRQEEPAAPASLQVSRHFCTVQTVFITNLDPTC